MFFQGWSVGTRLSLTQQSTFTQQASTQSQLLLTWISESMWLFAIFTPSEVHPERNKSSFFFRDCGCDCFTDSVSINIWDNCCLQYDKEDDSEWLSKVMRLFPFQLNCAFLRISPLNNETVRKKDLKLYLFCTYT